MVSASSAKNLFRTFKEVREKKAILQKLKEYQRFFDVSYESKDFIVKTAAHGADLLRALELRHEVFVEEWQGRRAYHGLDADKYDFQADHLIIIDKRIDDVIGTYRLLSSHFTHDFYSKNEFHLSEFLRTPSVKLEMGRACIHSSHRTGAVIDVLWKGLAQYIAHTKTEFLFGCSSVKTTKSETVARLMRTLKDQGSWTDRYNVTAQADYSFAHLDSANASPLTVEEKRRLFPPLLRSYLHSGAKVYGEPALDLDFGCTDILTILDWSALNSRFQSRFT